MFEESLQQERQNNKKTLTTTNNKKPDKRKQKQCGEQKKTFKGLIFSETGEDCAFRTLHLHTVQIKGEREAEEKEKEYSKGNMNLRNLKYRRNKFFNKKSWRNLPELRKKSKEMENRKEEIDDQARGIPE